MDKTLKFIIVKRIEATYDRPLYEKDLNVKETIIFVSYTSDEVRAFDGDRNALGELQMLAVRTKCEDLYRDTTAGLEILD